MALGRSVDSSRRVATMPASPSATPIPAVLRLKWDVCIAGVVSIARAWSPIKVHVFVGCRAAAGGGVHGAAQPVRSFGVTGLVMLVPLPRRYHAALVICCRRNTGIWMLASQLRQEMRFICLSVPVAGGQHGMSLFRSFAAGGPMPSAPARAVLLLAEQSPQVLRYSWPQFM